MNGKQSKKLRAMAVIFHQNQPPDVPRQTLEEIYRQVKKLHKIKNNGNP